MARSLNKVMLIGNVGNDPEIRSSSGGARIAKLSLATNRVFQDRAGQQQERTDWHRLTFFGRLAEIVEQYVRKGQRIYVEGRLEYSQTQDDQGGTRYWTDIVVNDMVMLTGGAGTGADEGEVGGWAGGGGTAGGGGGGAYGGARSGGGARGGRETPPLHEPDDDLPF